MILFFLVNPLCAQVSTHSVGYGLEFSSHEVIQDQRTSLNLNPEDPFHAAGVFEIKFDLSFKRFINSYGYILRVIANDSLNFDLVCSAQHEDFDDLTLIINNAKTSIHFDFPDLPLQPQQWIPVSIRFDPNKNQVEVTLPNHQKVASFPVSKINTYRLFFGANDFGKFNTTDVPPMILKDVEVSAGGMKPMKWQLRQHGINEVRDNSLLHRASVKNPTWLIDKQTRWVHRKEFTLGMYPSVAFKSRDGLLYASDKNSLSVLDLKNDSLKKQIIVKGNTIHSGANQLIYIEDSRELVNYDLNGRIFSRFNSENKSWQNNDTSFYKTLYRHNNKFYNPFDSSLYTFGGYGYFSYTNKFHRYLKEDNTWEEVTTSGSISPRYLAALGLTQSRQTAFIFGGYGSESGKQELFPKNFYNLFAFDLKTHAIKKVWEFKEHGGEDIVFSNSLVVNEQDSCFYVLSYHKNTFKGFIKLRKYSLQKPEFTILADSIPFQFHDEQSFCDLFFSAATNELIAVTSHKENGRYKVNTHSINYPPLNALEVYQPFENKKTQARTYLLLIFVGSSLLLASYLIFKRKKQKTGLTVLHKEESGQATQPKKENSNTINAEIINSLPDRELVVSTIYLFGGFQVFDRKGADITSKFPSTLKELFALLILHSLVHERGISTSLLCEHFWPDKDEVSARNNRNVNITKLRALLEEVGDIKIENSNSYHRLLLGSDVFCDYHVVSRMLNNPNALNEQMIDLLLRCSKRGSLLSNFQLSWLDNFKSDISNKIIDVLLAYSQKLDFNQHDKMLIEIADTIFNHDSVNQEALVIKCSVLNKKGKYSLAKTWYDHFAKEYKSLYSQNYPKTFDQVIT